MRATGSAVGVVLVLEEHFDGVLGRAVTAHHAVDEQRLRRGDVLDLAQAIVIADLDNEGIFTLFVGFLRDELILDLLRRAAEGHLVELCHVVAEAQAQLRVFLDEEVDDAHDALGRFVKGVGRGVALAHHHQHAAAVGRLAREKAIEEKAREVKARDR